MKILLPLGWTLVLTLICMPIWAQEEAEEEETVIETVIELHEAPSFGTEQPEEDATVIDYPLEAEVEDLEAPRIPDANEFVFAEQQPVPQNMDTVKQLIGYPQMCRDAGIEGIVVMRVLVNPKGQYVQHKQIMTVHPLLSLAVEKHIDKLEFTPAIQGGKPIHFWVNMPFNFTLLKAKTEDE